jgi:Transposase DDE domain group 1
VRRYFASFSYRAQSWSKPRRIVAKVEWHPGELYPRVGFIITNLARPAERVVAFYNQRGTAEQWIKEGKNAIKWTRLSCRTFAANVVRLQLHALAYNLGNFMRTLAIAQGGGALVANQPAREADQDRCEGRRPWPVRDLPDGRGRGVAKDVRRHPVVDRPAVGTARAGMSGAGSLCGKRRQERYASVCSNLCNSAFCCPRPPASSASRQRRRRFAVAQAGQRRGLFVSRAAYRTSKTPRIWRMSVRII